MWTLVQWVRNRSVNEISLFHRLQMLAMRKYISSQAHYNFGSQMEVEVRSSPQMSISEALVADRKRH